MFQRPLVVLDAAAPAEHDPAARALATALAPGASIRACVVVSPLARNAFWTEPDFAAVEAALDAAEERLSALSVPGTTAVGTLADATQTAVERGRVDVVVLAGPHRAHEAAALARALGVAVACGHAPPGIATLAHPFDGRGEALVTFAAFLRDRCDARHEARLVALGPPDPRLGDGAAPLALAVGIRARVVVRAVERVVPAALGIDPAPEALSADLLVHTDEAFGGVAGEVRARLAEAVMEGDRARLFLPPIGPATPPPLEAFDALALDDGARVRLEGANDGPWVAMVGGERLDVTCEDGVVVLPAGVVGPVAFGAPTDGEPLATLGTVAVVARPDTPRVTLVDARVDATALGAPDRTCVFVRVFPEHGAPEALRARRGGGPRPLLVDLRELLDEGDARDVPREVGGVRLCRAAARLREQGVPVDAVVTLEETSARGHGFSVVPAARLVEVPASPALACNTLGARLDVRTASRATGGNRVRVELDNRSAREGLLSTIDGARRTLHAQWYIVEDDPVAGQIADALARAHQRGVEVRLLVDSLYARHGSLGTENPVLLRLAAAGLATVAHRPIAGVPSLADLKQRDHRKVLLVDGHVAEVSGRNLGAAYYQRFDEVAVAATTEAAAVPWLDASVRVEGPAVAVLEAGFSAAWRGAGGAPYEAPPVPAPAGSTDVRVVEHLGLADAYTLEAYLTIVAAAREELVVVNSFPLQHELLRAFLGALGRGVRLRLLVGRARPTFGDEGQPFGGRRVAALADTLVRARLAALVEAGADVRELCVRPEPGWPWTVDVVHPHVHAKLLLADRRVLALGSANLDVTAGYWESEALVVLADDPEVSRVATLLEPLVEGGTRIERDDPRWQAGAALRDFVGRAWPTVLG